MTTTTLKPTDMQAAVDAIMSAQPGDTLVYNIGSTPGPLGPLFWRLGAHADGAGMFALVRSARDDLPRINGRQFEYRAQRTGNDYDHKAVQRAAKV